MYHLFVVWVRFPLLNEIFDFLDQHPVVVEVVLRPSHVRVIPVANRIVETLDIPDEHLTFPLFSRELRVCVVIQKHCELHTARFDLALVTLRRDILARSVAENGECKNGRSDRVETGASLAKFSQWLQTRGQSLDLSVVLAL